jgi:transposase-like protein
VLPPVAIVWPCALSVDAYVALGKNVEAPRPDCPGCSRPMTLWSGYLRPVRVLGRCEMMFVRRARCRGCAVTHALLPAFVLVKRLDAVETIGEALTAVVRREAGVRPVATALLVPHTTARSWIRRFSRRAEELGGAFAALALELGAEASGHRVGSTAQRARGALGDAFAAASGLLGWAVLGPWRFAAAVSGGSLLCANASSPYLVIGKRRFMPPVPFSQQAKDGTGET